MYTRLQGMNHKAKNVCLWMDVLVSTTDRIGKFELELIILYMQPASCYLYMTKSLYEHAVNWIHKISGVYLICLTKIRMTTHSEVLKPQRRYKIKVFFNILGFTLVGSLQHLTLSYTTSMLIGLLYYLVNN